MKPFNPDFIPAVGDIDAFLKVRKPGLRSLLYDIVAKFKESLWKSVG